MKKVRRISGQRPLAIVCFTAVLCVFTQRRSVAWRRKERLWSRLLTNRCCAQIRKKERKKDKRKKKRKRVPANKIASANLLPKSEHGHFFTRGRKTLQLHVNVLINGPGWIVCLSLSLSLMILCHANTSK